MINQIQTEIRRPADWTSARTLTPQSAVGYNAKAGRYSGGLAFHLFGITAGLVAALTAIALITNTSTVTRTRESVTVQRSPLVSKVTSEPTSYYIVDSKEAALALGEEITTLQVAGILTVSSYGIRTIDSAEQEDELMSELSWMGYQGIDYRVVDTRDR